MGLLSAPRVTFYCISQFVYVLPSLYYYCILTGFIQHRYTGHILSVIPDTHFHLQVYIYGEKTKIK